MKPRFLSLLLLVVLLLMSSGCNPDSPFAVAISPPTCSIIDVTRIDASFPEFAKIRMTVENTGEATAFDVGCEIKLKTGNTIIARGAISFGTLESQEACVGEDWFSQIQSHTEYDYAEYYLYWYDSQGDYHDSFRTLTVEKNKEVEK